MARPKKSETDTTSVVEETVQESEKNDKPDTENDEKPADEKPIDDDAKIIIKCAAYAGKSIVLPTRTIQLDEKGCCEVTGIEAKRLLTIPGYERK